MQRGAVCSGLDPTCMACDSQSYCYTTVASNGRSSACNVHSSHPRTGANEPHVEVAGELPAMPPAPRLGTSDTGTFEDWATPRLVKISHPWESMPRDELGMPQTRAESPLSWPPLSAAEREIKNQGVRELEAAANTGMWGLGLDHSGVWSSLDVAVRGQSAWTVDGSGRAVPSPPSAQHTIPTTRIGLGLDFAFGNIDSLSELQVALAFERA